jgi:hypothetical protein
MPPAVVNICTYNEVPSWKEWLVSDCEVPAETILSETTTDAMNYMLRVTWDEETAVRLWREYVMYAADSGDDEFECISMLYNGIQLA